MMRTERGVRFTKFIEKYQNDPDIVGILNAATLKGAHIGYELAIIFLEGQAEANEGNEREVFKMIATLLKENTPPNKVIEAFTKLKMQESLADLAAAEGIGGQA